MSESSHVTFGGKWVWNPMCEMPEDDSVSLVLCYTWEEQSDSEYKGGRKKIFCRRFSRTTKSQDGECMCILAAVYSHKTNQAVGSKNLERDLVREIRRSKESLRFF